MIYYCNVLYIYNLLILDIIINGEKEISRFYKINLIYVQIYVQIFFIQFVYCISIFKSEGNLVVFYFFF